MIYVTSELSPSLSSTPYLLRIVTGSSVWRGGRGRFRFIFLALLAPSFPFEGEICLSPENPNEEGWWNVLRWAQASSVDGSRRSVWFFSRSGRCHCSGNWRWSLAVLWMRSINSERSVYWSRNRGRSILVIWPSELSLGFGGTSSWWRIFTPWVLRLLPQCGCREMVCSRSQLRQPSELLQTKCCFPLLIFALFQAAISDTTC